MKNLRLLFFAVCLGCFVPVLSYAQGIFIPPRVVTGTVNGITRPIAGATVTVCAANSPGTPCSPPLANTVFKDSGLTVPLSNPFTTDANGNYPQAALAGGVYTITESAPGFVGFSYQATVTCAAGAPCTIVGPFTITGALTATSLNNTLYVNSATAGVDWCAKVNTVLLTVPSAGALVDALALNGAQGCGSNPYAGVANPSLLRVGATTITVTGTAAWTPPSGSTLTGLGYSQSTIAFAPSSALDSALFLNGTSNIDIGGLTITGNSNVGRLIDARSADNIRIHNNSLSGASRIPASGPNAAITAGLGHADIWITDNIITAIGPATVNAASYDIEMDPSATGNLRIHVLRNQISGSNAGISISCYDCVESEIAQNQVNQNNKIRSDTFANGGYAILVYSSAGTASNTKVDNNNVSNTAGSGINFQSCVRCMAIGNTVKNVAQQENTVSFNPAGIEMNLSCNSTIVGNVIDTSTQSGISLEHNPPTTGCPQSALSNTILNPANFGIAITGGAINNAVVVGNTVQGSTNVGISVPSGNQLTKSQIAYNNIFSPAQAGMLFSQLNDVQIDGNNISGVAANKVGIQVNSGGTGTTAVKITNNDIFGGTGTSEGIVTAGTDILIQGNIVHDAAAACIDANNAASANTRIDNNALRNCNQGIISTSATNTIITNNSLLGVTTPFTLAAGDSLWGNIISTGGGFFQSKNTVRLDQDFTTANNTSLQLIAGSTTAKSLTWTTPAAALNYDFHCGLSYSQATANAAVAFGIQAATNAPTNIFANGAQQITVGPPATFVTGTLPTLNTTTATNIVSGTPGATATNYTATLDGTVELAASVNTINVMVSTAAGADAVTVKRGGYCTFWVPQN